MFIAEKPKKTLAVSEPLNTSGTLLYSHSAVQPRHQAATLQAMQNQMDMHHQQGLGTGMQAMQNQMAQQSGPKEGEARRRIDRDDYRCQDIIKDEMFIDGQWTTAFIQTRSTY